MGSEPRDHHWVPQFYLRNFATDPEKLKICTVAKHGDRAVWARRSIASTGFDRDFYLHRRQGRPVSVEHEINSSVETPISKSETWAKISSDKTAELDRSDKAVLYALIRHLHVRTPHFLGTLKELAQLSGSPQNEIPFTDDERKYYTGLHTDPNLAKSVFNRTAASLDWTEGELRGAGLSIFRSPVPFFATMPPVIAIKAPMHPALRLPLPGMTPTQLVLALNPSTIASLVLADFDDAFLNMEISIDEACGFNRQFVAQFAYFKDFRHLIAPRENIIPELEWAGYRLVEDNDRRLKFQRFSS